MSERESKWKENENEAKAKLHLTSATTKLLVSAFPLSMAGKNMEDVKKAFPMMGPPPFLTVGFGGGQGRPHSLQSSSFAACFCKVILTFPFDARGTEKEFWLCFAAHAQKSCCRFSPPKITKTSNDP